ncbi:flagellar export protein FliJ [Hydrogenophaga sp. IBVHS1]|jgi:flagellar FliJ protein|uniref:flagellar export protein FliJ n=1 Tax=unclassified Hydrogenophaga TaxID=2610897 RepID=UPI000A2E1BE1|nr:flagellar export protein FliJ [Hydrogenophaga sp. IBVHS1]OSZ74222.1 flagellar export protein FliJ [Hydrogenophaga sp. IBVHS1]
MTTIQTLNKVVELAEKRRDEAMGNLGRMQRELQIAQDQMDQLSAYAQESQARWQVRSSVGVDTALLMHHRQFMQKIDHAMEFQRGVLGERQAMIERSQEQVHAAERDLAGLRKFTERKQQAITHRAERQEQKQTDELALAIHLRQSLAQAQSRNEGHAR